MYSDLNTIDKHNFNEFALSLLRFQAENTEVFGEYLRIIDKHRYRPGTLAQFPFLPIQFFKTFQVLSKGTKAEKVFKSSATSGMGRSSHYMHSLKHYREVSRNAFERQFGPLEHYTFAAILPNYQEQGDSSLIYMVDYFMKNSAQGSAYYLKDQTGLHGLLEKPGTLVLFGVSYALLDLAENMKSDKEDLLIIETGGMKGRKKEITREELYMGIRRSFPNARICSEYGMTELSSQAYSDEHGILSCPPWMKVLVRDDTDPFHISKTGKGALNIIDLANIHSCAFIATDDLAEVYKDGRFRILGRMDNADQRGCALLLT